MPMLKAERISCSGPKLSDAQTRNFEAIKHSGWAAAVEGALRSLEATGGVDAATLELAAARAAAGDALVEYDEPVDLSGYDRAFGLLEGGAAGA